jgi:hypothetical protein
MSPAAGLVLFSNALPTLFGFACARLLGGLTRAALPVLYLRANAIAPDDAGFFVCAVVVSLELPDATCHGTHFRDPSTPRPSVNQVIRFFAALRSG